MIGKPGFGVQFGTRRRAFVCFMAIALSTMLMLVVCGGDGNPSKPGNNGGGGSTFTDSRDGKTYRTVVIGTQTWMAENLNFDASGSVCHGNEQSNCDIYGRLYDWTTVMNGAASSSASPSGVRGICPAGWHVPSDAEWEVLVNYAGGELTAGTKLKSRSGWDNGGNGSDDYGFSAFAGGSKGDFSLVGSTGFWWSATEFFPGTPFTYLRYMRWDNDNVYRTGTANWDEFYSLRCLRD